MRIADVMTENPICCVPSDTAQVAALIMRDEDVGIVPVVGSDKNRVLVGVVTDRNLCLSVIAERHDVLITEGEDPTNVPIEIEPMSGHRSHNVRPLRFIKGDVTKISISTLVAFPSPVSFKSKSETLSWSSRVSL